MRRIRSLVLPVLSVALLATSAACGGDAPTTPTRTITVQPRMDGDSVPPKCDNGGPTGSGTRC
ncbi:MAG TPA: hypothetical protein VFJ16_31245 [Longimicrobium sp.]|nr:hypothetical protein [Longimicrobium sp.]